MVEEISLETTEKFKPQKRLKITKMMKKSIRT